MPGIRGILIAAPREHDDVAAGAEAATFGMVDDHQLDGGVVPPLKQRGAHRLAHLRRQGMDRLGAVQPDPPDPLLDTD